MKDQAPSDLGKRSQHVCCSLQKDLIPVCRELGIGIVCYSPIGRGMLAGKYTKPEDLDPSDFRAKNPRFLKAAFEKVSIHDMHLITLIG